MRHLIIGTSLFMLAGCGTQPQQATQIDIAPKVQATVPPVTPTVVWSQRNRKLRWPKAWRSKTDPQQLKVLSKKQAIIKSYISDVDSEIVKLVAPPPVSNLQHYNWQEKFGSAPNRENYGGILLLTVNPKNHIRAQQFRVMPGVSMVTVIARLPFILQSGLERKRMA